MRRFLQVLLLFIGIAHKTEASKLPHSPTTVKTVAIYSSKNTMLAEYPIDSLIYILNAANKNKNIIYYKCTEDNSKTGFSADYLVDLDFWSAPRPIIKDPSQTEKVEIKHLEVVMNGDGTASTREARDYVEKITYNTNNVKPFEVEVRLKIVQKAKNQKVLKKRLQYEEFDEEDAQVNLMIKLSKFILEEFSKDA